MTTALYVVALITLGVSFFKSKEKTIIALKKAGRHLKVFYPNFNVAK